MDSCFDVSMDIINEIVSEGNYNTSHKNIERLRMWCNAIDQFTNENNGDEIEIEVDEHEDKITAIFECKYFQMLSCDCNTCKMLDESSWCSVMPSSSIDSGLRITLCFSGIWG